MTWYFDSSIGFAYYESMGAYIVMTKEIIPQLSVSVSIEHVSHEIRQNNQTLTHEAHRCTYACLHFLFLEPPALLTALTASSLKPPFSISTSVAARLRLRASAFGLPLLGVDPST